MRADRSHRRVARKPSRLTATLVLAVALSGCGLVTDDQNFELTITNDTPTAMLLSEPCLGCQVAATPMVTIQPGTDYTMTVLANGGSETFLVTDQASKKSSCLPISYRGIPPAGPARTIRLSNSTSPCQRG